MGLANLISRFFRPKWQGTPEMFLAMVEEMALRNNPDYSSRELIQLGLVMQKLIKVNLYPYKNFADLVERAVPDESIINTLKKNEKEVHHRRYLKQAIYGENADLGDDDALKSDSAGAVFARRMVKNMSKYVEFSEEERRKIDEFDEW